MERQGVLPSGGKGTLHLLRKGICTGFATAACDGVCKTVRKKEPIELAHEIKQAFAKAHLYIDSDSEKEIDYLRKWYFHQTV